ncbi:MAG: TRAP transporter small permease [Desulfovibrionaceae bacterium]
MLHSTLKMLNRTEEVLSSTLMICMVIIISAQVFCRYVLQNSLEWSEELARYIFIWAVYFGASYALQKDKHLEITLLRHYLPSPWQRRLVALAYGCVLFFCLYTAWFGGVMVIDIYASQLRTPAIDIPAFWFWLCIPICFALMALRAGLKLWELCLNPQSVLPPTY